MDQVSTIWSSASCRRRGLHRPGFADAAELRRHQHGRHHGRQPRQLRLGQLHLGSDAAVGERLAHDLRRLAHHHRAVCCHQRQQRDHRQPSVGERAPEPGRCHHDGERQPDRPVRLHFSAGHESDDLQQHGRYPPAAGAADRAKQHAVGLSDIGRQSCLQRRRYLSGHRYDVRHPSGAQQYGQSEHGHLRLPERRCTVHCDAALGRRHAAGIGVDHHPEWRNPGAVRLHHPRHHRRVHRNRRCARHQQCLRRCHEHHLGGAGQQRHLRFRQWHSHPVRQHRRSDHLDLQRAHEQPDLDEPGQRLFVDAAADAGSARRGHLARRFRGVHAWRRGQHQWRRRPAGTGVDPRHRRLARRALAIQHELRHLGPGHAGAALFRCAPDLRDHPGLQRQGRAL